jgi:hypothetical protein
MGGCPHISIKRQRGTCKELKHNLKEIVLLHYLNHKRNQAMKQLRETVQQQLKCPGCR